MLLDDWLKSVPLQAMGSQRQRPSATPRSPTARCAFLLAPAELWTHSKQQQTSAAIFAVLAVCKPPILHSSQAERSDQLDAAELSLTCMPALQLLTGSIGYALSSFEWRLEATALGHNPLGQPPQGQLLLKGPRVFKGYHKDKVTRLGCVMRSSDASACPSKQIAAAWSHCGIPAACSDAVVCRPAQRRCWMQRGGSGAASKLPATCLPSVTLLV